MRSPQVPNHPEVLAVPFKLQNIEGDRLYAILVRFDVKGEGGLEWSIDESQVRNDL